MNRFFRALKWYDKYWLKVVVTGTLLGYAVAIVAGILHRGNP